MENKKSTKHKHLTLEERTEIQDCLMHGMSFQAIGQRIGKDQTTASKEVKRHITVKPLNEQRFDAGGNLIARPSPAPSCSKRHLFATPSSLLLLDFAMSLSSMMRIVSSSKLLFTASK